MLIEIYNALHFGKLIIYNITWPHIQSKKSKEVNFLRLLFRENIDIKVSFLDTVLASINACSLSFEEKVWWMFESMSSCKTLS